MVNGERQRRVCPCAATNKSDKDKSVNGLRRKAHKVKENLSDAAARCSLKWKMCH